MELRSTCLKEKPVLVTVYVEKPIKGKSSKSNKNHHHHHYRRRRLDICRPTNGGGYNRKAEIIRYSHRLRESAKPTGTSSPDPLKSLAVSITEQLPCPQIIPSQENEKVKKHRVCFEWVSFRKFNDKTTTKKNITQSFLYKVMATLRKFM